MSDFGSIITVRKKDNGLFSDGEFEEINELCNTYKKSIDYKGSMGTNFLFDVGKTVSANDLKSCNEINIVLSNYYGGKDDFKWHKDIDVEYTKIIKTELTNLLKDTYILQAKFEWW